MNTDDFADVGRLTQRAQAAPPVVVGMVVYRPGPWFVESLQALAALRMKRHRTTKCIREPVTNIRNSPLRLSHLISFPVKRCPRDSNGVSAGDVAAAVSLHRVVRPLRSDWGDALRADVYDGTQIGSWRGLEFRGAHCRSTSSNDVWNCRQLRASSDSTRLEKPRNRTIGWILNGPKMQPSKRVLRRVCATGQEIAPDEVSKPASWLGLISPCR